MRASLAWQRALDAFSTKCEFLSPARARGKGPQHDVPPVCDACPAHLPPRWPRRLRPLRSLRGRHACEREFFIRKAIGWVLRDTGRRRPDLVYEWLLPRAARASAVTIREAVKPLSPVQRAAILAAR
jgi:hypothetical protein